MNPRTNQDGINDPKALYAILSAAVGPVPGIDFKWMGAKCRLPDGSEQRIDGLVLGGFITGSELKTAADGPWDVLGIQARYVAGEFTRRLRAKFDAATGEILWLRRPQVYDMDGSAIHQSSDGSDRWEFIFRAYFFAPGVTPTLVEGGPIPFVRAPGT